MSQVKNIRATTSGFPIKNTTVRFRLEHMPSDSPWILAEVYVRGGGWTSSHFPLTLTWALLPASQGDREIVMDELITLSMRSRIAARLGKTDGSNESLAGTRGGWKVRANRNETGGIESIVLTAGGIK